MIAETAYFLAQERGFAGGDPVSDWIEAERRVDRELGALAIAAHAGTSSVAPTAAKKLGALKRRVSALAANARTDLNADVEKLDGLKLVLRNKLGELRERGDQVSQHALHQAEHTWNELSDALQRLAARTRH